MTTSYNVVPFEELDRELKMYTRDVARMDVPFNHHIEHDEYGVQIECVPLLMAMRPLSQMMDKEREDVLEERVAQLLEPQRFGIRRYRFGLNLACLDDIQKYFGIDPELEVPNVEVWQSDEFVPDCPRFIHGGEVMVYLATVGEKNITESRHIYFGLMDELYGVTQEFCI